MSEEDNGSKWLYVLGGAAAVGALVYALRDKLGGDEEEERPPIIVKNSSLRFISGDERSNDPDESHGKAWEQNGDDWQPDHRKGKRTKWFVVELKPAGPNCPALSMTKKLTITFDDGAMFTFKALPRTGGGGGKAPTLITDSQMRQEGSSQNPELVYGTHGSGRIARVEFETRGGTNVTCTSASEVWIWPF